MPSRLLPAALAAACLLQLAVLAPAEAEVRRDTPYAIHSMVYTNAPLSFKEAMFRQAAALGASSIRVDVFIPSIVTDPHGKRDWAPLDEYVRLARRYRLQVVGVLLGTPGWLEACPADVSIMDAFKCPASDPRELAGYAGEIAGRARGVIDDWEVLNEPDGRWAYLGAAADYARHLTATAAAIHAANPRARVLLGGVMTLASRRWLREVFAAACGAARAIDVATVHVRGRLASLPRVVRRWRAFFARHGARVPLWITEHGYPSDPTQQTDPAYHQGEAAQAAYLVRSLPALLRAGAARVFVTERDNLHGAFASEGLLGGTVADPPVAHPVIRWKPSAAAFAALATR